MNAGTEDSDAPEAEATREDTRKITHPLPY